MELNIGATGTNAEGHGSLNGGCIHATDRCTPTTYVSYSLVSMVVHRKVGVCVGRCLLCERNLVGLANLRVPQVSVPPQSSQERRSRETTASNWVQGKFIRGPIPLSWLNRACRLSGPKVLPVALAIWFLAGLRGREDDLNLTTAVLDQFAVTDRSSKSRALKALEKEGLIEVIRQQGKNPRITILEGVNVNVARRPP